MKNSQHLSRAAGRSPMASLLFFAVLVFICMYGALVLVENAAALQSLRCEAEFGGFHRYRIDSVVDLNGASNEGELRSRTNSTQIESTINLGCDQERFSWTDSQGKKHNGQLWRLELLSLATTRRCPSAKDGWTGEDSAACSADYKDVENWNAGDNAAYFAVDLSDGYVYWDNSEWSKNSDIRSCQSMHSTLVQLQAALRSDETKSSNDDSKPKSEINQRSRFENGVLHSSNRFEVVERPSPMFEIPGMAASSSSTIRLIRTFRDIKAKNAAASAAMLKKKNLNTLMRIDSEDGICPIKSEHVRTILRDQFGCDKLLLSSIANLLEGEQVNAMHEDDRRRVVMCLNNEDREERKQEILNWLLTQYNQDRMSFTPVGVELLGRIGSHGSQSVLAEILSKSSAVESKLWLSNIVLFQVTDMSGISDELLNAIEKHTDHSNAVVRGNAWLALASIEHNHVMHGSVRSRPTKIVRDMQSLRTLPTELLIDVLNNAGSALPVSEVARLVFDKELSEDMRVRATVALRRRMPDDAEANSFIGKLLSNEQLGYPIHMGAIKAQQSRDASGQLLQVLANDSTQSSHIRKYAKQTLQAKQVKEAGCVPYDLKTEPYMYNVTTGRCSAKLGDDDLLGGSASLAAFAGLTYRGCNVAESRLFRYALEGEANLEAHILGKEFNLLDFELKQVGESTSTQRQDILRLIIRDQVHYNGALFQDSCVYLEKLLPLGTKRLFTTNLSFVIGPVPMVVQVELSATLHLGYNGQVCPIQMKAHVGASPTVDMNLVGHVGAGIKGISAGLNVGGSVTMGLLPSLSADAAACPHLSICPRLASVIKNPSVQVLATVKFLGKSWQKTVYKYTKIQTQERVIFDKCYNV